MSLSSTQRYMGASAKNQQIANLKNTVWNWKKMIGRAYNDPLVQQEKAILPYEVIQMDNGMVGLKVGIVMFLTEQWLKNNEREYFVDV